MKIIDGRLRPATPSFLKACLGVVPGLDGYHKRFGCGISDSVIKCSIELCIQEMDEAGIIAGIMAARWGLGNQPMITSEEILTIVTEYPGRFFGGIPFTANRFEECIKWVDEYVINGPVTGVSIEPLFDGVAVNDRRLYPLYEVLSDKSIPLFLMGGSGFAGTDPTELKVMLDDFPQMTVIDNHGHIPYIDEAFLCALFHPNYYICPDMYAVNTPFTSRFVDAANCMLQDQIMFGSAYPALPMKDAVEAYLAMPFKNDKILEKVMYVNATRALKIAGDS